MTLENTGSTTWDERDERAAKAQELGIAYEDILPIYPARFKNNQDGPCHTDEPRKKFWTDVLISLQLSLDTLIMEARHMNEQRKQSLIDDHLEDLEERIEKIKAAMK